MSPNREKMSSRSSSLVWGFNLQTNKTVSGGLTSISGRSPTSSKTKLLVCACSFLLCLSFSSAVLDSSSNMSAVLFNLGSTTSSSGRSRNGDASGTYNRRVNWRHWVSTGSTRGKRNYLERSTSPAGDPGLEMGHPEYMYVVSLCQSRVCQRHHSTWSLFFQECQAPPLPHRTR
jgi:hypothetical protein